MTLRGPISVGANRHRTSFLPFTANATVNQGTSAGGYAVLGALEIAAEDLLGVDVTFHVLVRTALATATGSVFLYDTTDGDELLVTHTVSDIAPQAFVTSLPSLPRTGVVRLEVRAGLNPAGSYTPADGFTVLSAHLKLREY